MNAANVMMQFDLFEGRIMTGISIVEIPDTLQFAPRFRFGNARHRPTLLEVEVRHNISSNRIFTISLLKARESNSFSTN